MKKDIPCEPNNPQCYSVWTSVCLPPSEESEAPQDDDWNAIASKDLVLKIFDSYPEDVKALLRHAPEGGIKLWDLLDLPALETVRPSTLLRYHTLLGKLY